MSIEHTVFFDDVDVHSLGLYLQENHTNPIISGTRDKILTIDGSNGAYDYGANLEPIDFSLPLFFYGGNAFDVQEYVRKIKSLLLDEFGNPKTFKLKFGYELDKYYNVRVVGSVNIERLLDMVGDFTLNLRCFDGCAFSTVKSDEVNWGNETITFENNMYTYGHGGSGVKTFTKSGTTIVTVMGNNLRPIVKVSGTGTNVKIGWSNKKLELGTFSNANWIIDLERFIVTKDGVNSLHLIKGDWLDMYLFKGDNEVTVDGRNLNINLEFEFRDKFF